MTAMDMTTAVSSLVVTARAEQMPSTWTAIGVVVEDRIEKGLVCLTRHAQLLDSAVIFFGASRGRA